MNGPILWKDLLMIDNKQFLWTNLKKMSRMDKISFQDFSAPGFFCLQLSAFNFILEMFWTKRTVSDVILLFADLTGFKYLLLF